MANIPCINCKDGLPRHLIANVSGPSVDGGLCTRTFGTVQLYWSGSSWLGVFYPSCTIIEGESRPALLQFACGGFRSRQFGVSLYCSGCDTFAYVSNISGASCKPLNATFLGVKINEQCRTAGCLTSGTVPSGLIDIQHCDGPWSVNVYEGL